MARLENENTIQIQQLENLSFVNRFILSRLADTVIKCQHGFENYRLFEAADAVKRFIVEDVCDVYVEFSKANLNNKEITNEEKVFYIFIYTSTDLIYYIYMY